MPTVTLDKFFAVTKKTRDIFYVDWSTPQPLGIWLKDMPEQITFCESVSWKDVGIMVKVCCWGDSDPHYPPLERTDVPNKMVRGPPSVSPMKSLLQKAIRRQMLDLSIITAKCLIDTDIDAFLRRLSVIMMEDASLHQSLTTVVWLMSAVSKGYQIKINQIDWLLGVVRQICENKVVFLDWSKSLDSLEGFDQRKEFRKITKEYETPQVPQIQKGGYWGAKPPQDIMYSLLYRYTYGGMKNDLIMFAYYIEQIPKYPESIQTNPIIPIDHTKVSQLTRKHFIVQSIDFHCYPHILQIVIEQYPQYSEQDIKQCIWHCNSKTNIRLNEGIEPRLAEIWDIISQLVVKLQMSYIERIKLN